jgi:hypothetical protein
MLIFALVGYFKEGLRISQVPLFIAFLLHAIVYFITGYKILILVYFIGFAVSSYGLIRFGLEYSKVKPSGPFRVGVLDFTTKDFKNDCTIFYPAANDGSGHFGIPFLNYG